MAELTNVLAGLTPEQINGIIIQLGNLRSMVKDLTQMQRTMDNIAYNINAIVGYVPEVMAAPTSLAVAQTAVVRLGNADAKYATILGSKFDAATSIIADRLFMSPKTVQLTAYISGGLSRIDLFQSAFSALPPSNEGQTREVVDVISGLDNKTMIDMYLTLYARQLNLNYLNNILIDKIGTAIDKYKSLVEEA